MATFLNENFVPDNPLLKMLKPLPADFNFGAAFVEYTDTLIGEIILYSLYNISYIIWAISCASPDGLDGVYVNLERAVGKNEKLESFKLESPKSKLSNFSHYFPTAATVSNFSETFQLR